MTNTGFASHKRFRVAATATRYWSAFGSLRVGLLPLAAAMLIVGCGTAPLAPTPAPAPPRPSLQELMQDAQNAKQAGAKEKSRQHLREAAQSYPTTKEPWLKLAEDYFEATDYGNAILAAQEVSARDPQDRTANSILAVSGLRVASSALVTLRNQSSGLTSDARTEAQSVTKTLRETIGDTSLVPRPETTPPPPPVRPQRRPAASAAGAGAGSSAAPGSPAAPAAANSGTSPAPKAPEQPKKPATPAAPKAANPLDILKNP